jgi:hypothetical protein
MMDFFQGLDNEHYSMFKTDCIDGFTSKAINLPKDLNEIYLLVNQWLKPKAGMPALSAADVHRAYELYSYIWSI